MDNALLVFGLLGLVMALAGNVILVFANGSSLRPLGVFLNTSGLSVIGTVFFAAGTFT